MITVEATRSARTGSSGQPIVSASAVIGTGPARNARTSKPRPWELVLEHNTFVALSRYYDDQYWEPEHYWAWQDSIWKDPPTGTVSVKPLEVVHDAPAAGEADGD